MNGGDAPQRINSSNTSPGRPIPMRGQVKGRIVKGLAHSVASFISLSLSSLSTSHQSSFLFHSNFFGSHSFSYTSGINHFPRSTFITSNYISVLLDFLSIGLIFIGGFPVILEPVCAELNLGRDGEVVRGEFGREDLQLPPL